MLEILKNSLKQLKESFKVRNFEEFSETVERKFQSLDEIIKDNMGSKLEKQKGRIMEELMAQLQLPNLQRNTPSEIQGESRAVTRNPMKPPTFDGKTSWLKGRIMEELMAQLQLPNLQRNTPSEIQGESRAVTRNPMKPPTFDGKTSWLTYIKQFEAAAVANAWSSSDRTTALILALRGDASDILQTLPPEELQDYSKIIKRLRLQKKGENLQEFEADLKEKLMPVWWTLGRQKPLYYPVTLQKGTVLGWCCPISAIVLKVEAEKDPPFRSKILPEKLGKLVTSTSPELQTERNQVKELVCRYQDIFDMGKGKTGRTSLVQHKIDTGDARPIRQAPRRLPFAKREEADSIIEEMRQQGKNWYVATKTFLIWVKGKQAEQVWCNIKLILATLDQFAKHHEDCLLPNVKKPTQLLKKCDNKV
ncbi:hypothetical protein QE152_g30227 [Popillia japonica]|uniref:Uncharacterized protein n=1 Tax=Popillia japonica TaxID=7064 RepID=A0AAW1JFD8_POPJA